jgi:hypothetical protein
VQLRFYLPVPQESITRREQQFDTRRDTAK